MSAALLAGQAAFVGALRRSSTSASRSRSAVKVFAGSWKLEKPQRLWEIGSEMWVPGTSPPSYLDASLPGDRGFDPLRLGEKVTFGGKPGDALPWLIEGELYNGRLAMLAVLGVLFTEATGKGPWFETGVTGWLFPYWPVVLTVHLFFATMEWTRYQNFATKGEVGLGPFVPFDPLKLNNDYRRQSEIRNGRLAMLSNLGYWCQAAVTGKGAIACLQDHLADPTHNNILATPAGQKVAIDITVVGVLLFALEAARGNTPATKKAA